MVPQRVKVNVLGRVFEVSLKTLEKIPYIRDMWEDCGRSEKELYIERSSTLFEHVLALVIDDTYLFPCQYEQELRFYGVAYNKAALYNANHEMIDTFVAHNLKLTELVQQIQSSVVALKKHNQIVNTQLYDLRNAGANDLYCLKCHHMKEKSRIAWSTCEKCVKSCLLCGNKATHQYCDEHAKTGQFCLVKGCRYSRLPGKETCIDHITNKK